MPLRLLLLTRMIEREMARDLQAGFKLTVADWRVLALTCSTGSTSAGDVRTVFEADRAEVSRAVSRLLKANLIQRKPDSRHRQKVRLTPTDAGQVVFDGIRAMREEYFAWILQDLSPEERQNFEKSIQNIALRVDERRSERNLAGGHAPAPMEDDTADSNILRSSEGRDGETNPAATSDHGDPDQER